MPTNRRNRQKEGPDLLWIGAAGDDQSVELADWLETKALVVSDGTVSETDLAREIQRARDVRDETALKHSQDAFREIQNRIQSCVLQSNGRTVYPYLLDPTGTLLETRIGGQNAGQKRLYIFLLLVSRLGMKDELRRRAGHDPTQLFEQLCAEVLRGYWGGNQHTGSFVFGTAGRRTNSAFSRQIDQLCDLMGEGKCWKSGATSPGAGDGGLDVVVWKQFSDGRQGNLIGFAQCKAGWNWRDDLQKLRPDVFCRKYMQQNVPYCPLRLYMVPHRIAEYEWENRTMDAGLLIDRCRLMQYSDVISRARLQHCQEWADALLRLRIR